MNKQLPIEEENLAKPEKFSIFKPLFLAYAFLFLLLAVTGWSMVNNRIGPLEEGMAPDFSLTSFDGEDFTLFDHRGKVIVINFWASWCPPCREEAAYLEETWKKYKDEGVIFIGVNYADTQKEALAYIEEFEITYFNGPDLGTRISQLYNLLGVPETFYISKTGELSGVKIGPLTPPELDNKIDELLAE